MALQRFSKKSLSGFTLMELAIVLGIFGVILSAIWLAAGKVSDRTRAEKASGEVMQILNNYRSIYSQHGVDVADGTDITCLGINAGFFPTEMIQSGTACSGSPLLPNLYPLTPWSTAAMAVTANQTNSAIVITVSGLSVTQCNNFSNAVLASPDVLSSATPLSNINGTSVSNTTTTDTVGADCSVTASPYNSVQIYFKAR